MREPITTESEGQPMTARNGTNPDANPDPAWIELGTRAYTWATWEQIETIANPDWARFDYARELAAQIDPNWRR